MKAGWIIGAMSGVLLTAVAGVALYKSWPLLFPEILTNAPLNPECDLRSGPCLSRLPEGGSVSFSIGPRSIPVVKPLQYEVVVEGLQVKNVEVDFSGVDMNMGFNRSGLQQRQDGTFAGSGRLPVCVRDTMEWEAKVLLHTDKGIISAPYRFITVKPGLERTVE